MYKEFNFNIVLAQNTTRLKLIKEQKKLIRLKKKKKKNYVNIFFSYGMYSL